MPDPISSTARTRAALLAPAMAILIFAAAGPLIIVVLYSFLTPGDYGGVVWDFSTDAWFGVLAERDFFTEQLSWADAHLTVFWRSIKLSLLTALLSFIFGFPTAYFIATRPRRSRDIWMLLVMIPFWTNLLIRTFAIMELIRNEGTINTVLIAMGLFTQPVQMLYTEFSLLLGMTYVYLPLMILPIYASMERFDFRLVEAGYDLYATRWQVLRRVILPIVKPGIVAGSILVFVPCLGAYVTPRVLGGGKQLMLGNLIELQFGQLRNWPLGAALSLTLLVIVMVALIFYVRTVGAEERGHG
ncbi:ABC transporter permease [Allosediminivita pacifica]|uniref:ABC-type spermidine/putrescine transport system permease subunit I n=1 Tax=Allosediminivita pacifica TaxID=1267769 RepID=A0A2T6ATQ2_9RHOB|nr:ABC transporter permease [Allosediminivita pacifica]PTX47192.1 ABC-type spermidine/putrescine transport system permease subunit I [Allosediminivita pacifica]GGB09523.1 ABC transporter permease [Allosediminivita pacifica]